jgi:hypothetical protein
MVRAQGNDSMLQDLARRAAIYLFPVREMYRVRWQSIANDKNFLRQKLNTFFHIPVLGTHKSRLVTTPNNDTLYSAAWLELSGDPLFLTVPAMGERYYSFAFMDMFTNNFAYVCHRLDGGTPRPRMIVGPKWQGTAPSDVTLVRAPTNSVWLLGRILVDGPSDLANGHALQAKTLLETPDMRNERRILEIGELMRQNTRLPAEPLADWPPLNPDDPFDLLTVGMRALGESPLAQSDRDFLDDLAPLKLRPGFKFDARAFSDAELQAIRQGLAAAKEEIRAAGERSGTTIDGWNYPAAGIGNFGTDYLYRAVIALIALAALEPAEAVYLTCNSDSDGRPLDGSQRYTLHFPPNALPPVKAFWSLTMYEVTPEGRAYLIDNELSRYAVGDRTPGLARAADGGLTLHLQHDRPSDDKMSNWLPAPQGPMRLLLRAYEPGPAILEGKYRVPAVKRL